MTHRYPKSCGETDSVILPEGTEQCRPCGDVGMITAATQRTVIHIDGDVTHEGPDYAICDECLAVLSGYPATEADEVTTATKAPEVDRWHMPQRNAGQMIEVSYGVDEDGQTWARAINRSAGTTQYTAVDNDAAEWD